jgi:hypothetical protein
MLLKWPAADSHLPKRRSCHAAKACSPAQQRDCAAHLQTQLVRSVERRQHAQVDDAAVTPTEPRPRPHLAPPILGDQLSHRTAEFGDFAHGAIDVGTTHNFTPNLPAVVLFCRHAGLQRGLSLGRRTDWRALAERQAPQSRKRPLLTSVSKDPTQADLRCSLPETIPRLSAAVIRLIDIRRPREILR